MDGIPPVVESDAEDVAWALQTADALWRRHEAADAIVWLRRAAQAAGEVSDDDRALVLARAAADLTELIERRPMSKIQSVAPAALPERAPEDNASAPELFDDDETPTHPKSGRVVSVAVSAAVAAPRDTEAVLDPWAEPSAPTMLSDDIPPDSDDEEVVTSAPPLHALRSESRMAIASQVAQTDAAASDGTAEALEVIEAIQSMVAVAEPPRRRVDSTRITLPDIEVDLNSVAELVDLPDDARAAFSRAALVNVLSKDDEAKGFALALVISGAVDVAPTVVDATVLRLKVGSVLRAQASRGVAASLRLIGATDRAVLATWDDAAVAAALHTCPWVEDELSAAADQVHALVGAAMGPLGEASSEAARAEIATCTKVRALLAGDEIARPGEPLAGLFVVGTGEVELVDGDAVIATLHAGELVFAKEALRRSAPPYVARAGRTGALVLMADHDAIAGFSTELRGLVESAASSL